VRRSVALSLLFLAAAAVPAAGKGLDVDLRAVPGASVAGEQVRISLRAVSTIPGEGVPRCDGMRVVVVAPGVSVKRALRSLEGGRVSRRIGAWGAFRLASLRPSGELRWSGVLRPGRPGRWTLVVPNWCTAGFVLPLGVTRSFIDVRPPDGA
jgi:hypothetical protein